MRRLFALSVVIVAVFAACGDGSPTLDDVQSEAREAAEDARDRAEQAADEVRERADEAFGNATVEIAEPTEGAAVEGPDVTVRVEVSNFEVVPSLGEPATEGEGHVHFYLDVAQDAIPTDPNAPAVTGDKSTYHATADTSHTWTGLSSGDHVFCVQLVDNDHTALEEAAVDCVTVTVG